MERTKHVEVKKEEKYIKTYPQLIENYGYKPALFIGNLIDKYKYFKANDMIGINSSFFLTFEQQTKQIGLSKHELRECKKIAIENNILDVFWKGQPAKEFYILNLQKINQILGLNLKSYDASALQNTDTKPSRIPTPYKKNKGNKNKEKEKDFVRLTRTKRNKITPIVFEDLKKLDKITPSKFELFWKIYPKGTDKGKAKSKWEAICRKNDKDTPTWDEVKIAIRKQRKSERWQNKKYIPHPTTWLNQQRWLDDPAEMKGWDNDVQEESNIKTTIPKKEAALMMKDWFSNDTLYIHTYQFCFKPIRELFLKSSKGVSDEELAQHVINLYSDIERIQKKNFNEELFDIMSGPVDILSAYARWLKYSDWISDLALNNISVSNILFKKFCREEAKNDNLERDPLTGQSYMRE